MAPLITLLGGFAILRLLGTAGVDPLDDWRTALRGALALMFLLTASAHFAARRRADLIAMVPHRLPRPDLFVAAAVATV